MEKASVHVMEGWLYLIHSNSIGLQYSKKRYFVLQHHHLLQSFKSQPHFSINQGQDSIRSVSIDSGTRVTDNGKESIQRRAFYVFTLQNVSNPDDHVKLGTTSPEEAARWIKTIREASIKADLIQGPLVACSKRKWQYARLNCFSRVHNTGSLDWSCCLSSCTDPTNANTIAPSTWKIFNFHNGLRLFKETKDREHLGKSCGGYPAIMAICVVNGTSEAIFQTIMSLGSSRVEWDFCFHKGTVIEHIDGHTDIVHKVLYKDWLPGGIRRRDLLLHRCWRRDEDGAYVILYQSVVHKKCPPQKGYVRASLKSGGYIISPVNEGQQSVVRHMLAINWKYWKPYRQASSDQSITIRMLGRLAALRELFSTNPGRYSLVQSTLRDLMSSNRLHQIENMEENEEHEDDMVLSPKYHSCRVGLDDISDELFHASERLDFDEVQTRSCMELDDMVREDGSSCYYGATLPKDPTCNLPSSWSAADASIFEIRGKTYLRDNKKVRAKGTLMQMVGVDFVRSNKREDDLGARPGSIVQKAAANGGHEFFFIVNLQVPGSITYGLAYYLMMNDSMEDAPLLSSFIKGDDAYRNSRFKLLVSVSKGPWIVKQSLGKKASLVGQRLPITYIRGKNYLELDVDVGGTALARRMAGMVCGYFSHLVIEIAFLIEANTEEELPEHLLGAFRLNYLDISKSVLVTQK